MHVPRLPDWLVYGTVLAALVLAAHGRREREDAPSAPPPPPGLAQAPIAPGSPFAADRVAPVPRRAASAAGTAFSVDERGLWLTAGHVINGCGQVGLVVAEGRGVAARVLARRGDLAVLQSEGGAPGLPLAGADWPVRGEQLFQPGYPQGAAGEVAARMMGRQTLGGGGRGGAPQTLMALVEDGRTEGLGESFSGLSGAPVLDEAGRVVGVTLGQSPRRGRLYAAPPELMAQALAAAGARPAAGPAAPLAVDDYGRVADALRRDLRVVQVVCLAG